MSLIINGIDFEKRCEDAKRQLYLNIEWHAQCLGMAKYFNVVPIIQETPEAIKRWQESLQHARDYIHVSPLSEEEQQLLTEHARKYIEQYLLRWPLRIQFELIRL